MPIQPIKLQEIPQMRMGMSDEFIEIRPEMIQRILSRSARKLPISLAGKVLDGLQVINSPDFPPEIRSVVTGIITDGVMGGLDAAVFNNMMSLPLEVLDFAKDSFETLGDVGSEAKDIVGRALQANSLEEIVSLTGDSISFVNSAITDTSALLQTFGNIKGLPDTSALSTIGGYVNTASGVISNISQLGSDPLGAASGLLSTASELTGSGALGAASSIVSNVSQFGSDPLGAASSIVSGVGGLLLPGSGIVKTASNILGSIPSIAGGLGGFSVQGLGLKAASLVLGTTPAGMALNLAAPLLGGLFGGLFGGKSKCPCHKTCRKTDHFVAENGVILLDTCAPLIMSSPSALQGVGGLLSKFL